MLAEVRLAKGFIDNPSYQIETAFEDSSSKKRVWTLILLYLLKAMVILSIILVICVLTAWITYFGYIADLATTFSRYIFYPSFIVIGIVITVILITIVILYLAPASYEVQNDENNNISKTLLQSVNTLREKGKKYLLIIMLFHLINLIIYLAVGFIIYFFVKKIFILSDIILMFIMISYSIFVLIRLPRHVLSYNIAKCSLFADLFNSTISNNDTNNAKIDNTTVATQDNLDN